MTLAEGTAILRSRTPRPAFDAADLAAAPEGPTTIEVRGAREHNLRNIDVDLPRDALVVITGLSGSGKSSLAFDTLYAEGQRRYVESLSAYARQFLDQLSKPEVDSIEGLSPAIAIEQKTVARNARSTVGTTTEIYDYLRLLYARAGRPFCHGCERPISSQTVEQMAEQALALGEGALVEVMAPVVRGRKGSYRKELEGWQKKGFVRARIDGKAVELAGDLKLARAKRHDIDVVVDRLRVKQSARARIVESLTIASDLADGLVCIVRGDSNRSNGDGDGEWLLSKTSGCPDCGISYPEIAPRMFSFNSPAGACPGCDGLGTARVFDPERVVPDPDVPLAKAIAPWAGRKGARYYRALLEAIAEHLEVDLETPWRKLPKAARKAILEGTGDAVLPMALGRRGRMVKRKWTGVMDELDRRAAEGEEESRELDRYRRSDPCGECNGARVRLEARYVKVADRAIHELTALSLEGLAAFFDGLELGGADQIVAERLLDEIRERLGFLLDVGLGYLTLDRASPTLSGGESQRIRLATQIGSSLMGVLYILDEPSVGLHARDHGRLIESLLRLRDMGNSIIVVEHDEATIRAADYVIDMGPGAGRHGGEIVAQGPPAAILAHPASLTGAYLSGSKRVATPRTRRKPDSARTLQLVGCNEHNLKNVTLEIPLGLLTVVTGVSGSGKSTLIGDTLHRVLAARLQGAKATPGHFESLSGIDEIDKVIDVDQAPIGRTPRSNPATYTGAFDGIRNLFAQVPEARMRGYGPGRFSFNVKGGRCESCTGDGSIRVEMNFLPDLFVTCEVCSGRRYNRETLEIRYKEKTIAEVLDMPVEDACEFFASMGAVARPLEMLRQVGLGYLHLGQAATTLSGGEAQRIKLARELQRRGTGKTLYLLDEPTTGLHFADIEKLVELMQLLVERGNTVVVIEHQLDVVRAADHVIDLGPEGGEAGGEIVIAGTPEQVAACKRSHTGHALAEAFAR